MGRPEVENEMTKKKSATKSKKKSKLTTRTASIKKLERLCTRFSSVDKLLGGGLVRGKVTILAGAPGVGKTTLAMQLLDRALKKGTFRIISNEQSRKDLSLLAARIDVDKRHGVSKADDIYLTIWQHDDEAVIVDSLHGIPIANYRTGGVSAQRAALQELREMAVCKNIPIIVISHVNKENVIPNQIIHETDVLLYLDHVYDENDACTKERTLTCARNRFATDGGTASFAFDEKGFTEVKKAKKRKS
jgi:DNA repair protein RadA/Sms